MATGTYPLKISPCTMPNCKTNDQRFTQTGSDYAKWKACTKTKCKT